MQMRKKHVLQYSAYKFAFLLIFNVVAGEVMHTGNTDGEQNSLGFIAIGDWGMGPGHQTKQFQIAKAMNRICEDNVCHFIVSTGDNLYSHDGNSFDKTWRNVYTGEHIVPLTWYISLGNHDRGSPGIPTAHHQIEFTKREKRWHLPNAFYTFEKHFGENAHVLFVVLDTTLFILDSDSRREQTDFLKTALSRGKYDYRIVIGHHPVYSTGYYSGESRLRDVIVPIMEQHQVDVYLCGHDHNLQHLRRQDDTGPDYVVSGAGGGLLYGHRPLNTDIVRQLGVEPHLYEYKAGFTYFNITENQILVQHYAVDRDVNQLILPTNIYEFTRSNDKEH